MATSTLDLPHPEPPVRSISKNLDIFPEQGAKANPRRSYQQLKPELSRKEMTFRRLARIVLAVLPYCDYMPLASRYKLKAWAELEAGGRRFSKTSDDSWSAWHRGGLVRLKSSWVDRCKQPTFLIGPASRQRRPPVAQSPVSQRRLFVALLRRVHGPR